MSKAIEDITAERRRQIEVEGWSFEHDDKHVEGEMADAAACYALYASNNDERVRRMWPWDTAWWKPASRRKMLVKAAALLVAEIERLDRADRRQGDGGKDGGA
jgi:hypothetical protein